MKKVKQFLGLKPLKKDKRDFVFGSLFGISYEPKFQEFELPKTRIMDQRNNICAWCSATAAKEVDEGVACNPQTAVKIGKKLGYIKQDGFASLRSPQLVIQKQGVAEESVVPETDKGNWPVYSADNLTQEQLANMAKHKSQSFWSIFNHLEAIKAMDEGHAGTFGVDWFSSSNNLGDPFFLKFTGTLCGGHAMKFCGYSMPKQAIRVQNSFGTDWGDGGYCWIKFTDFNKFVGKYGSFCSLDIAKDAAQWVISNSGKLIKEKNGKNVYFIENGLKRLFKDEFIIWAFNFRFADIITDEEDMLSQIKDGEPFVFEYGPRAADLKEIMRGMDSGRLVELGKLYFPEFFKK